MKQQLINWYLEYVNDFITIKGFAEFHGVTIQFARSVVEMGREFHESTLLDVNQTTSRPI